MALSDVKPAPLGFGLGLRACHYDAVLADPPAVDWFEVISENYMVPGGRALAVLEAVRARYPIVLHGVSLSIASTAPLDLAYLDRLKALARRFEPAWVSDHLCWTGVHGVTLHDLLPFPYTEEALAHVAARVDQVQERLGRAIALENVSTYVTFRSSSMTEWEFLSELTRRTGCWLLLDVNNVYVSAFNHGYAAVDFLAGLPPDRVLQFHLAGHEAYPDTIIDTHDRPVSDPVWALYGDAIRRFGPVSTLLERDEKIPPLAELVAEIGRARAVASTALTSAGAAHRP